MNRKLRTRIITIVLVVVFFLSGFIVNYTLNGSSMPHEQLIGVLLTPVRSGFSWCSDKISFFFSSFTNYKKLQSENDELRMQVRDLQTELDKSYYYKTRSEYYNSLNSITETSYTFSYASADVVSHSNDGYTSSIGLNAGTSSGIKKGDVVVAADGLVGKVTEVGLNWSVVSTMIDINVSVGAMVLSTGEAGVAKGDVSFVQEKLARISYLNRNANISRGDKVYTSGLGGMYPKGILMGTVSDLYYEDNGLTLTALLQPSVDFDSLKYVLVIVNFEADQ